MQVTIDIGGPIGASNVFENEAMFERVRRSLIFGTSRLISQEVANSMYIDVFMQLFANHADRRRVAARQTLDKLDAVISIGTNQDRIVFAVRRIRAHSGYSVAFVLAFNSGCRA